jgi:hypothetical protein
LAIALGVRTGAAVFGCDWGCTSGTVVVAIWLSPCNSLL